MAVGCNTAPCALMRPPKSLQVIYVLALLSLAGAAVLVLIAFAALMVPPGEGGAAGFMRGALEALGYAHESFGAYEMGTVLGGILFAIAAPLAVFLAVRLQRLWMLRVAAVFWLLISLGGSGWTLIPLVVVVLSFMPSVRRYFRDDEDPLAGEIDALGSLDHSM